MNYKLVDRVPTHLLANIKKSIEAMKDQAPTTYRIALLDPAVIEEFRQLIFPDNFECDTVKIDNIKVFISPPGTGCRWIHKDGIDKKCALNVTLDCNPKDWVRWYSDDEMAQHNGVVQQPTNTDIASRDLTNVRLPHLIPYVEEITNQHPGDVYLVNTDVFHFFRNQGSNYRYVIQTKFAPNPSIEEVYERIQLVGLNEFHT
jgi:hypothetical protein